jgi:hypothetical protein
LSLHDGLLVPLCLAVPCGWGLKAGTRELHIPPLPVPQVEHPVTEWISNVNIPAAQLMIGMGVPLHAIPDLRRLHGADPAGSGPLDFESGARVAPAGHVVAVRITAGEGRAGVWRCCGADTGVQA